VIVTRHESPSDIICIRQQSTCSKSYMTLDVPEDLSHLSAEQVLCVLFPNGTMTVKYVLHHLSMGPIANWAVPFCRCVPWHIVKVSTRGHVAS
jgi:hypothetical protein